MQLKYKYLSGVATDKDSPTLRKAYQEDYSKCPSPFKEQASFDRNIAVRHSEIRLSRNYGDSDNRRSR